MEKKDGRKKDNVKGLVHKSKRFLPMNLLNPKEVFFGAEEGKYFLFGHVETGCIRGGRLKAAGLKEKFAGDFSRGIILCFFKSSNRVQVLACSFR